jgi:predicted transcriptional regulator of viral defense system
MRAPMENSVPIGTASAKRAVAEAAAWQWGRVTVAQIRRLGVHSSTITRWRRQGYLHLVLPSVYAVGHPSSSTEADCAAALLYAGPGAMLSHATAAWWLGLIKSEPRVIHVSTPRRCRSQPKLRLHSRRSCERIWHRGLPTTTVAQAIVDYAASASLRQIRHALANADYHADLDLPAINALLANRPPGAARLRTALERYEPRFARTKSGLEIAFLELCEEAGLEPPQTNVRLYGWEIDAFWPEQRIAVELDGAGNHRTPAQMRRDRQKDVDLRSHGLISLRYSDEQLEHHRREVAADVIRAGAPPRRAEAA